MECPGCYANMTQRAKPYDVGSGSGKTARITEYECDNCGDLSAKDAEVKIPLVQRDAALAHYITMGRIL